MRLITFILSSGIALTCVPAYASAAPNTLGQTIASTCPINEGYPDCHADGVGPGRFGSYITDAPDLGERPGLLPSTPRSMTRCW